MRRSYATFLCFITVLVLTACSSMEKRAQKLQLGMSKEEAIEVLNSDYTVVAARTEGDGSPVEVLKFPGEKKKDLFLYFRNSKLTQWGDTEALQAMPPGAEKK